MAEYDLAENVLEDLFGADPEEQGCFAALEPTIALLTQSDVLQAAWITTAGVGTAATASWCSKLLAEARQQQQSLAVLETPDTLLAVVYAAGNCVATRLRRQLAWQDPAHEAKILQTALAPLMQAVADMQAELSQLHIHQARARQHAGEARVLHAQYQELLDDNLRQNELLFQANEELEDRVRRRTSDLEKSMVTIKAQTKKMQELITFKDELVRMVVHDLKTPLGVVISVLDGVLSGFFDIQRDDKLINTATQSAKNMLDMVETMLDISRLESGRLDLNLDECAVNQVMLPAIATVQILADERKVSIVPEVAPGLEQIMVDRTLLRRVLTNLLSNATRFAVPGSQVVVSVVPQDNAICFAVSNHGVSISEADQAKIFDMFVRLNKEETSKRKSTGIGLTFCKLAVEAHGGRIWVTSPLGPEQNGAKFAFVLPQHGLSNP